MRSMYTIMCLLIFCVSVVILATVQQNNQIQRGVLVKLNQSTFIDKINKTITDKSSVFPNTLWENKNGQVLSRDEGICYRAYLVWDIPANSEQLALYRKYFPKV